MPTGLKFIHKIILLMVGCIAFTGTLIAVLFAAQFRQDLLKQEQGSSYTVYQAAANYLTGHYFAKHQHFVPRSLNYVFSNKFLVVESESVFEVTHRPSRVVVYEPDRTKIYEYSQDGVETAPDLMPADRLSSNVTVELNDTLDMIVVSGPIDSAGAVPGYVVIHLPTDIGARLHALYLTSALILMAGLLIATGLAYYGSRRFLAPVQALTDAARRVHAGDYACRIDHVANDEIGLLTSTFNEMVESWVRRLSLMHRIQEWTLKVGNEFDRHRLYARLLDMFHNVASSRQCALYLREEGKTPIQPVAVRGDETMPPELNARIRFVLEKNEPVWIARSDSAGAASLGKVREMVLPLLSGERPIGAVYIGPPGNAPAYDDEMVATLQTLAQHAGIAVDNARLLNEVAEKKRIEQEMMWARDIQQTLLPHQPLAIPGYTVHGFSVPANEVGGDYFDYLARDNNLYHIIVSDVSGKGVAAGLIMSVLRSLIHTYTEFEESPHNIMKRVNRVLTRDLDEYMFVTATMLTLNPVTHQLQVARAGHEPVLMITADGTPVWIKPQGTALGLLDVDSFEANLKSAVYTMAPGDTALMYTDGINEAQNADGEEFGLDRLMKEVCDLRDLPIDVMLAKVIERVRIFVGDRHQQDDITLVALRRNITPAD